MWNDAAGYESYVGHWSRTVAPRFLAWLAVPNGLSWLDVGCGTGALTAAILAHCRPGQLVGLDASSDYLAFATAGCRDPRTRFVEGEASALPFPAASFDVSVSGLALNFIAFGRALAEQNRIVRPGGTIAAYVWDYAGGYEFARRFWDAAISADPRAAQYDPARTAIICRESNLRQALAAAGCTQIETVSFEDSGEFPSREAYWHAFDGRQGSTSAYLSLLTDDQRDYLKASLLATLNPDGPLRLRVRALAVKGLRQ